MKWQPSSAYGFPTAILHGMSDAAYGWRTEGIITKSENECVRFFFSCTEAKPAYAEELLRALRNKIGQPHRSPMKESVLVEVVGIVEKADVAVTFSIKTRMHGGLSVQLRNKDCHTWRSFENGALRQVGFATMITNDWITVHLRRLPNKTMEPTQKTRGASFKPLGGRLNRMRNTVLLILVSALLNGAMVILGRGSWLHTVAVLVVGIYVGLPALILGGCGYLLGYRFTWGKRIARVAVAVFVSTASLGISLIPGQALVKHDIAEARKYCESLIPDIDRYRQEHGMYPLEIAAVVQDMPHLLRHGRFYWSDGQVYRFDFGDPRGMMNGIGYMSQNHQWFEWH